MAHRHASLIDLYIYTKIHSNMRSFCARTYTYVRTDGRTDIEAAFIRSTRRSRPKKSEEDEGDGEEILPSEIYTASNYSTNSR